MTRIHIAVSRPYDVCIGAALLHHLLSVTGAGGHIRINLITCAVEDLQDLCKVFCTLALTGVGIHHKQHLFQAHITLRGKIRFYYITESPFLNPGGKKLMVI